MALQIHRYTVSGTTWTRQDALLEATGISFERGINGTDSITFSLPRGSAKIADLTHGAFVRVHDTDLATDLAAGRISGRISLTPSRGVQFQASGLFVLLAEQEFPPEYIIKGDISSADNKARLTRSFDWRRVTATAAGTFDGNEIVNFQGDSSAYPNNSTAKLAACVLYDIVEGSEVEDAMGALIVIGTTNDAAGFQVVHPYSASGLYESPFLDFQTAPTAWDVLRVGVNRGQLSELEVQFEPYTDTSTRAVASGGVTVADPQGFGHDITGETAARFAEVKLELVPTEDDRSPVVHWYEVVATRAIDGIVAGTFVSVDIEDNLSVGGQTPLRALDQITQQYDLEYQVQIDGTVDVQASPTTATTGITWGSDRRSDLSFVEGVNVDIVDYSLDDSDLANYVAAEGTGAGGDKLAVIVQDSTSQTTYGVRARSVGFNEDTIGELQTEAADFLAERKDPRRFMRVQVRESRLWDIVPGDLITVHSDLNTDHTGARISRDFRVIRDRRVQTPNGVSVQIDLETRRDRFFHEQARRDADIDQRVSASIDRIDKGSIQTETITDGALHEYTVPLDFTPVDAHAEAIQLYDASLGAWYNSLGGATQAEVAYVRLRERAIVIGVKRFAGGDNFQVRLTWTAWGHNFKSGAFGA